MRLTVIGRYAPFPRQGGACSGYLLEHGGVRVLLDCGSGVLSKLQSFARLQDIRDVVVSHLHGDHTSDLFVLRYAADADLRHGYRPCGIRVVAPCEPDEEYARLAYKDAMSPEPAVDGADLAIGGMSFRFTRVDHPYACMAVTVRAGGAAFAYSGDTALCPQLIEAARGADLFLCEASLFESSAAGGYRGHMSARQAGLAAAEAGAKRLLITHIWPFHDASGLAAEAGESFRGPVAAAEEGVTYSI